MVSRLVSQVERKHSEVKVVEGVGAQRRASQARRGLEVYSVWSYISKIINYVQV